MGRMIRVRVIEPDNIFAALASLALDANEILGINVVSVVWRVVACIPRADAAAPLRDRLPCELRRDRWRATDRKCSAPSPIPCASCLRCHEMESRVQPKCSARLGSVLLSDASCRRKFL